MGDRRTGELEPLSLVHGTNEKSGAQGSDVLIRETHLAAKQVVNFANRPANPNAKTGPSLTPLPGGY